MKLCKDCLYYNRFWLNAELSSCINPNRSLNPVTGKPTIIDCKTARMNWMYTPDCGPEARGFKPKRTLFEKLFK